MTEKNINDFNRRDFLRGGSMAALMSMLGGVELLAQTNEAASAAAAAVKGPKVKVAVIGLGPWGRDVLNTLARVAQADVAVICDSYPAMLTRAAKVAPNAVKESDYKKILENKEIQAVVICTATHQHKEIAVEALKAGKHVYCEAPLAHTIEDARAIAKAAKVASHLVFQAGFQLRSDPQRHFLLPFIRSGALGKNIMARSQWHRKQSWRATSPTPERETVINWRLDKELSIGLVGEIGSHQIDQATWFLNGRPNAVTGFGGVLFWKDGREVADTVQTVLEFPGGVSMVFDGTLANSFDAEYEVLYGSDAAVMMRESKAWMFKEVDSPLLGWEVYAKKETFYKETGIALVAGASKSSSDSPPVAPEPFTNTPLWFALTNFTRSAADLGAATQDFISSFGEDDKEALAEHISKVSRQAGSGFQDAYAATVIAIRANEAVKAGKRLDIPAELYELT
jgi:predicted dehydrogenase